MTDRRWSPWLLAVALALLGFAGETAAARMPKPGKVFRDCKDCPPMVVLPRGTFRMGDGSPSAPKDEQPARDVTIRAFAVARTEITHAQFAAFVKATGYEAPGPCTTDANRDGRWETVTDADWKNPLFPTGDAYPVTCMDWWDAKHYADWLAQTTGKPYRLLTEAEFEYATRAGRPTQFWWGDDKDAMCRYANGQDAGVNKVFPTWRGGAACDDGHAFLAPVASYRPNAFGLYDMAGNAWEWTEDCYAPGYLVHPDDGSAYEAGPCPRRVTRGGSWANGIYDLRSAQRNWNIRTDQRGADVGFRVARDL